MAGGGGYNRLSSPFTTAALSARPPLLWYLPRPVVGGLHLLDARTSGADMTFTAAFLATHRAFT